MSISDPCFWAYLLGGGTRSGTVANEGRRQGATPIITPAEIQRVSATLLAAICCWSRGDYRPVAANEPFDAAASSLSVTPRSAQVDAIFNPFDFPRHHEALRRAKQRLKATRHHRDPFRELSPQSKADALVAPPSDGCAAWQRDACADTTSMRLLQETLLFALRDGVHRLQRRRINNAGGVLAVGHVGTVFIDVSGSPGELGITALPPAAKLSGVRFTACACLDCGVALLPEAGKGIHFYGNFREHTPAPPRKVAAHTAGEGGKDSPTGRAPPDSTSTPSHSISTVVGCDELHGSRSRLAALTREGALIMLSPAHITYNLVGGLQPFRPCVVAALGQGSDVFLIDSTRRLQKCSVNPKTCSTPRRATTLLAQSVFTVAAGYNFVIAVDTAGGIWAHGRNEKGQLGVGLADDVLRAFIPDRTLRHRHFVTGVACGRQHTVAVTASGAVFVCGDNRYGQLGLTQQDAERAQRKSSTAVNVFTPLSLPGPCIGVSCGTFTTLFVLEDGRVFGAGNNDYGQLGILPLSSVVSPPVLVDEISRRGGLLGLGSRRLPAPQHPNPPNANCARVFDSSCCTVA